MLHSYAQIGSGIWITILMFFVSCVTFMISEKCTAVEMIVF